MLDTQADILQKAIGIMGEYPTCRTMWADISSIAEEIGTSTKALQIAAADWAGGVQFYKQANVILAHYYKLPVCAEGAIYIAAYEYYGNWREAFLNGYKIITGANQSYSPVLYQVHDEFGPEESTRYMQTLADHARGLI